MSLYAWCVKSAHAKGDLLDLIACRCCRMLQLIVLDSHTVPNRDLLSKLLDLATTEKQSDEALQAKGLLKDLVHTQMLFIHVTN